MEGTGCAPGAAAGACAGAGTPPVTTGSDCSMTLSPSSATLRRPMTWLGASCVNDAGCAANFRIVVLFIVLPAAAIAVSGAVLAPSCTFATADNGGGIT